MKSRLMDASDAAPVGALKYLPRCALRGVEGAVRVSLYFYKRHWRDMNCLKHH